MMESRSFVWKDTVLTSEVFPIRSLPKYIKYIDYIKIATNKPASVTHTAVDANAPLHLPPPTPPLQTRRNTRAMMCLVSIHVEELLCSYRAL
jgi:hypothetical protein